MKVMKKTRWGAIALVIALVLASGMVLTGCENGPGSGRGFDPVGTWRGTHTHENWGGVQRSEITLTLWANGTGTWRQYVFWNNILDDLLTASVSYSVSDNIITITLHIPGEGSQQMVGSFTDNNTLILGGVAFRRN